MAKKSQTKKTITKKVVKSTISKVTKKKVAKSPAKKVVKKTTSKVAKKTPVKKVNKKKAVTQKAVVKKTASKKVAASKAKTTKKTTTKKTTQGTAKVAVESSSGPNKIVSRSNGSGVSERVAKLRMRLGRGGTHSNNNRVKIPETQLPEAQLKKIKSGLARKDLKYFKQLLINKRTEILGDFAQLAQDVKTGGEGVSYEHMADTGTDNFEQEFNLGLMESERALMARINRALVRIEDKTYGICILTGKPIGRERLEAKPWAQYCIEIALELDRQGLLDK